MKKPLEKALFLLDEADTLRPNIKEAITTLKSFGPEARELLDGIFDYAIDCRITAFNKLRDAGFSREEAINITMNERGLMDVL